MEANILILLNNDLFKSFILLLLVVFFSVFIKNYFDKKKLEKKILFSDSINDFQEDGFQHFNALAKTEIYAENLNPKFELIAKFESNSQNRFPKASIARLENVNRIGQMSVRLSDRVLGSLGNLKTFYVGILLANRHGSLSLIEHIEFSETLKSIANEFDLKLIIAEYSDSIASHSPLFYEVLAVIFSENKRPLGSMFRKLLMLSKIKVLQALVKKGIQYDYFTPIHYKKSLFKKWI